MFAEDLTAFFNTAEFASTATLGGVGVQGIFDNAYAVSEGGIGMATTNPVFTMATSAVPFGPVGRVFLHSSLTYMVAAHEPDGTGISLLILERTA